MFSRSISLPPAAAMRPNTGAGHRPHGDEATARGHRVTHLGPGATASGLFTGQETGGEAPLVEPFGFGWG